MKLTIIEDDATLSYETDPPDLPPEKLVGTVQAVLWMLETKFVVELMEQSKLLKK